MDFKDFSLMDTADKVRLIRNYIKQAGFENSDEHLGACLAVLDRFKCGETLKNKDDITFTCTAKLECEDVSFSETLNTAQQVVDTIDASLKSANEALDELHSKLSGLGLTIIKGKIVPKLNCEM